MYCVNPDWEWKTPPEVFDPLHSIFKFDIDLCAREYNYQLPQYIHPKQDSLKTPWTEERCWMNPPYDRTLTRKFLQKAVDTTQRLHNLFVCLVKICTDTKDFHHLMWREARHLILLEGRVQFINPFLDECQAVGRFASGLVVYHGQQYWDEPVVHVCDADGLPEVAATVCRMLHL